MMDTAGGKVYANASGMTLYTFDKDGAGASNCYDACAALWPPFTADAMGKPAGDWTIVVRKDGARMWAYEGKPLYTYSKDKKPATRRVKASRRLARCEEVAGSVARSALCQTAVRMTVPWRTPWRDSNRRVEQFAATSPPPEIAASAAQAVLRFHQPQFAPARRGGRGDDSVHARGSDDERFDRRAALVSHWKKNSAAMRSPAPLRTIGSNGARSRHALLALGGDQIERVGRRVVRELSEVASTTRGPIICNAAIARSAPPRGRRLQGR